MNTQALWSAYRSQLVTCPTLGLALDTSRLPAPEGFWEQADARLQGAFDAMDALEQGAIANPDEKRMVGHYWLRNSKLAPKPELAADIEGSLAQISSFAQGVHAGAVKPATAARFTDILVVGIGGSALGPQLMADALGASNDKMAVHFLDNTDPDGIQRVLQKLAASGTLAQTLTLVISKSGGTPETRNGMLEAKAVYAANGLVFAKHAVAVTGENSNLDKVAVNEGWLARFPMWDWVGGRTSLCSAVGLLPMALQGLDIHAFLAGAGEMDRLTRESRSVKTNPAARLAMAWHLATGGKGEKDMVVLPYKDRLLLMSRYLQQLIMESLGKRLDLDGNEVCQGISVYGNKGSTDQHAYVQQLRDGTRNFFAVFIHVLQDEALLAAPSGKQPLEVDPGVTSSDYLTGFFLGTREALFESGRASLTLTLDRLDAMSVGALMALHERAVGYYAALVNINAYHQPGVEAGKKAAATVLDALAKGLAHLRANPAQAFSPDALAAAIGAPEVAETLYHTLAHRAANGLGVVEAGDGFQAK